VNKGKKILDGTVRNVKQEFKKNLFQIGFSSMPSNTHNNAFEIIKNNDDYSLIVRINDGYTPNDVLKYFLQSEANITSFNEILPSLNDIFIQLVEGTPAARQFQNITA
jgi:ABC-2 type transport system ATP-binding protein